MREPAASGKAVVREKPYSSFVDCGHLSPLALPPAPVFAERPGGSWTRPLHPSRRLRTSDTREGGGGLGDGGGGLGDGGGDGGGGGGGVGEGGGGDGDVVGLLLGQRQHRLQMFIQESHSDRAGRASGGNGAKGATRAPNPSNAAPVGPRLVSGTLAQGNGSKRGGGLNGSDAGSAAAALASGTG